MTLKSCALNKCESENAGPPRPHSAANHAAYFHEMSPSTKRGDQTKHCRLRYPTAARLATPRPITRAHPTAMACWRDKSPHRRLLLRSLDANNAHGIPALMNIICEARILDGCTSERRADRRSGVESASKDLLLERGASRANRHHVSAESRSPISMTLDPSARLGNDRLRLRVGATGRHLARRLVAGLFA